MNKKEMIIMTAADMIHQYGYNNVGIKKILDETKIPKGSFYYYFTSKEDLGINIIELYIDETKKLFSTIDKNIIGLKNFFNCYFRKFEEFGYKRGCPIGNLALELSDVNENFRLKLLEWSTFLEEGIYEILKSSKLKNNMDLKSLASFIISNFEGALLKAKLEKSLKAIDEFNYYIFEVLLKEEGALVCK
ncbi:MAG: TetR/AcrR family transcriptional regulator [Marinisporobacter sp.]|jgi:TetR/AcrR family transcriptional repressor of nem operon|nr:TetR/AcrR family transcriptional regulator [Marinisporobacter sp.]